MPDKIKWVRDLVSQFGRQRILVVGDLMLDRYVYGSVGRISPEAPVPVVCVQEEKNMPGGAANVARNVQALGGQARLCGLVGQDQPGQELLAVLARERIDTAGILQLPGRRTTVKTRIVAEGQQVARVDWEARGRMGPEAERELTRIAAGAVGRATGVILADYAKGALGRKVAAAVRSAARRARVPLALDPKPNAAWPARGITVATPNRKEAFALAGVLEQPPQADPLRDAALLRVCRILLRRWPPAFLVVTLGAQGMLLAARGRAPLHIPTVAREVFDVSGAGDTVIAALLLALAAGASERQAAELATCAAGVVVGKRGTAVCTGRELMDFYRSLVLTGMDVARRA